MRKKRYRPSLKLSYLCFWNEEKPLRVFFLKVDLWFMSQKGLDLNFTVMGQLFSNIFDWLGYNVYTAFFIKYALMLCTNVPNFKNMSWQKIVPFSFGNYSLQKCVMDFLWRFCKLFMISFLCSVFELIGTIYWNLFIITF